MYLPKLFEIKSKMYEKQKVNFQFSSVFMKKKNEKRYIIKINNDKKETFIYERSTYMYMSFVS